MWLYEGCRFHPAHILSQTTGLVIGFILPHFYTGKQQRCRFCPIAGLFCRFPPQGSVIHVPGDYILDLL
ncbi:MAG: hypothetical protein ACLRSJ_05750, partial [Agathobaculum sp.]